MSKPEKGLYNNERRAARAAQTRWRIIEAAIDSFSARGYAATTMRDLATAAGVSVDTVHANGPKPALLQAAVRVAIFGLESDKPIENYEIWAQLVSLTAPAEFLDLIEQTFSTTMLRVAPLWAAVEVAADGDPDVATRRDELIAGAVTTLRALVRTCAERGWLGGTLTDDQRIAALYTIGAPGSVHLAQRDLNLDADGYRAWMRRTLDWALLGS
ncbi:MAG: helix-turn-helix domain-containing protein [Micropruina sp.]